MYIENLMKEHNMTRTDLSRKSGVPESTLRGILNGGVQIDRCMVGTLYCIAHALDTTIEKIMDGYIDDQKEAEISTEIPVEFCSPTGPETFYLQRFIVLDMLHELGDEVFIRSIRADRYVQDMEHRNYISICLYTVSLIDYLCRCHRLSLVPEYEKYRHMCLTCPIYPLSMMDCLDDFTLYSPMKREVLEESIPEFQRCNIYETEENLREADT